MSGPLTGVDVVELAGIGPAPFCGMVLGDMGARVTRVDRVDRVGGDITGRPEHDLHNRGKHSIAVDLKKPEGVEIVLRLVEDSDILIEGLRPGVTERLGLGPAACHGRNPALVYGRMTGWGQYGPLSARAGHDIDYIAISGALGMIGPRERPIVPLNVVGDFGGGGMLLAFGVLAALTHARVTGEGQVVDAAMTDGSALLTTSHHGYVAAGWWDPLHRSSNLLDGGAPFYDVYRTADDRHVAVGALEPQFFEALLAGLGLDPSDLPPQNDRDRWPEMREVLAARFSQRSRDEWVAVFDGTDACVAPVLTMEEAPAHPHNVARGTFMEAGGVVQPAPAPRFSLTKADGVGEPVAPGADTDEVLAGLGYIPGQISMLRESGIVA